MSQSSAIAALQSELVRPEGTQDEYLPSSSHQTRATPYGESRGTQDVKKYKKLATDSWGTYQKNNFSDLRLSHLPIHIEMYLNLGYLIFFNLQKIFDVQTTCLLLQNYYVTWLIPFAS